MSLKISILVDFIVNIEFVDLYWQSYVSGCSWSSNIWQTSHHQLSLREESSETSAATLHLQSPWQDHPRGGRERCEWLSGEWIRVRHAEEAPGARETVEWSETISARQDTGCHDCQAEADSAAAAAWSTTKLPVQPAWYGWVTITVSWISLRRIFQTNVARVCHVDLVKAEERIVKFIHSTDSGHKSVTVRVENGVDGHEHV